MKRSTFIAPLLTAIIVVVVFGWFCWFSPVTSVILVPHAERLNSTDTTSLSAEGFARAATLSRVVGSARIEKIFVSEKKRTQQTAQHLSAAIGVTPEEVPGNEIARIVDSVSANAGKTILIVGHSDTVPQIIEALGYSPAPVITPSEFDNMFVVTIRRWNVRLLHLKYGEAS